MYPGYYRHSAMNSEQAVFNYLDSLNIDYQRFDHPPVFTVEEAEKHWQNIEARHCKNIFLRDAKGRQHFLVVAPIEIKLDIRALWEQLGSSRLSFASEARLMKYLGLKPGSVSPFGLINDQENHVRVYLDESLRQAPKLAFHPNINTITLAIARPDLERFFEQVGNTWTYIGLPVN